MQFFCLCILLCFCISQCICIDFFPTTWGPLLLTFELSNFWFPKLWQFLFCICIYQSLISIYQYINISIYQYINISVNQYISMSIYLPDLSCLLAATSSSLPPLRLEQQATSWSGYYHPHHLIRLCRDILDCPETFTPSNFMVCKLSRLCEKLSRLSGNFPDCPEIFLHVCKLCIFSGNQFVQEHPDSLESFPSLNLFCQC